MSPRLPKGSRFLAPVIFILIVAFEVIASAGPATGFHLYYGSDPAELKKMIDQWGEGSVAVIDTRVFSDHSALADLLVTAKKRKATVISYLSIGEIHSDDVAHFRGFLEGYAAGSGRSEATTLESISIDKNETFNSYRIDALSSEWRAWIHHRASEILRKNPGGLFLDTVDTIDSYAGKEDWPDLKRRGNSISAMITLIRSLKEAHPNVYILQNGGLNMIGETVFVGSQKGILLPAMKLQQEQEHNPDGILWENAFESDGEWAKGRLTVLQKIQKAGHCDVFALGYQDPFADPETFFTQSAVHHFISAWAVSSEVLHKAATLAPPQR